MDTILRRQMQRSVQTSNSLFNVVRIPVFSMKPYQDGAPRCTDSHRRTRSVIVVHFLLCADFSSALCTPECMCQTEKSHNGNNYNMAALSLLTKIEIISLSMMAFNKDIITMTFTDTFPRAL